MSSVQKQLSAVGSVPTENESKLAAARADIISFLSVPDVQVRLTYAWAPETMIFPCKLLMDQDAKAARQKFYAQSVDDQARGEHLYYVELICLVLAGVPVGLPGFDNLLAAMRAENGETTAGDALRAYLGDGSEPRAKVIAEGVVNQYNLETERSEFFR